MKDKKRQMRRHYNNVKKRRNFDNFKKTSKHFRISEKDEIQFSRRGNRFYVEAVEDEFLDAS